MSTRDDAKLSEKERAALAGLEAKAEADDPGLAAQLRGRRARRKRPEVLPPLVAASRTVLGPIVAVLGLALLILTLSTSVAIAAFGLVVLVAGCAMSSVLVRSVVAARGATTKDPQELP